MNTDPNDREIFEIEDRRFRAMESSDVDTLQSLLAEDLHYVHANGVVEDKAEFLRKIRSGERAYRRFAAVTRASRREGDLTFVFGEAEVEVDRAAGRLSNRLTYTAVYRNRSEPRFFVWHAVKSVNG
jgi:ketosteroid isomerase-like protein